MSKRKERHNKAVTQRERNLRILKLIDDGYIKTSSEIPILAIPGDILKQKWDHMGGNPIIYYLDKEFSCKDCGKKEIWTASQQKWWYEIAQGFTVEVAVRCHSCRKKRKVKFAKLNK